MKHEVIDNRDMHRFEIEVDGMKAIAEYEIAGDTMVLTHTKVPFSHQGEGIGEALARAALDSARAQHLKVDPRCKYMAAFIERHDEYQDLLSNT